MAKIGGKTKPSNWFLPGRLRWTLVTKERDGEKQIPVLGKTHEIKNFMCEVEWSKCAYCKKAYDCAFFKYLCLPFCNSLFCDTAKIVCLIPSRTTYFCTSSTGSKPWYLFLIQLITSSSYNPQQRSWQKHFQAIFHNFFRSYRFINRVTCRMKTLQPAELLKFRLAANINLPLETLPVWISCGCCGLLLWLRVLVRKWRLSANW